MQRVRRLHYTAEHPLGLQFIFLTHPASAWPFSPPFSRTLFSVQPYFYSSIPWCCWSFLPHIYYPLVYFSLLSPSQISSPPHPLSGSHTGRPVVYIWSSWWLKVLVRPRLQTGQSIPWTPRCHHTWEGWIIYAQYWTRRNSYQHSQVYISIPSDSAVKWNKLYIYVSRRLISFFPLSSC